LSERCRVLEQESEGLPADPESILAELASEFAQACVELEQARLAHA
jgi:hypothetical protein